MDGSASKYVVISRTLLTSTLFAVTSRTIWPLARARTERTARKAFPPFGADPKRPAVGAESSSSTLVSSVWQACFSRGSDRHLRMLYVLPRRSKRRRKEISRHDHRLACPSAGIATGPAGDMARAQAVPKRPHCTKLLRAWNGHQWCSSPSL